MDKKESFYWDLVKGTAIFLMLWGHCIQYCGLEKVNCFRDSVFKTIYTFHMPVFMLVSGYLFFHSFQKRNLRDLLAHRIQGMLHPIVAATVFSNILTLLPTYILSNRADFLFGSLFLGIDEYFWFLWAVLYCSVIVAVCGKVTEKPGWQFFLMILGGGGILLVPQWNTTLFMYPYFVAGFFCAMYRDRAVRVYKILRFVMLVLFPVLLDYHKQQHLIYFTPMYSEELGLAASMEIALFRWTIGFVGSIWMLSIMEFLLWLKDRIPVLESCLLGVSRLGRNSLQIYCLSLPLLTVYMRHGYRKIVEIIGCNVFAQNRTVYDWIFTPALALAWSVVLYYLVVLLKKSKLHGLIFGR